MQCGCSFDPHFRRFWGTTVIAYPTGAMADGGEERVAPGSGNQLA